MVGRIDLQPRGWTELRCHTHAASTGSTCGGGLRAFRVLAASLAQIALDLHSTFQHSSSQGNAMTSIPLQLKVPPPLVALAVAALMWIASRAVQPVTVSTSMR